MDHHTSTTTTTTTTTTTSLFDVYLRLRPPPPSNNSHHHQNHRGGPIDRFLDVDQPESTTTTTTDTTTTTATATTATTNGAATHITIKPPSNDTHRKRAVEKFAFTKVFDEDATQLDVFNGAAILSMVEGVLGDTHKNRHGRDGLLATLGVTGSGKSHTILGSKSHRGLTQMALDALFQSIGKENIVNPAINVAQLAAEDVSEAELISAAGFLDAMYGGSHNDNNTESRMTSRAQTPMSSMLETSTYSSIYPAAASPMMMMTPRRHQQQMPSMASLPQTPSIDELDLPAADKNAYYAIVVSIYEVYNDRIFDLLNGSASSSKTTNAQRELRRRALLFKGTEYSPDRKVVCGLRKVVCGSFQEALLVLETGVTERRVAGTGSNAVSSRSHGFFCVEVKKRSKVGMAGSWSSRTLTIVDLAGSERARTAKTAGATLAEAGKINESLMYLGQCMQMQSDNSDPSSGSASRPALVPFRQCKLTELLFSNSFQQISPLSSSSACSNSSSSHRQQKATMIVTADPRGDFNATSQILRYSALAREVTVPRIPSVTSTILSGNTIAASTRSHTTNTATTASSSSSSSVDEDMCRLNEELAILRLQLEEETRRRREAETSWARAEERLEEIEAEIREECWSTFEERMRLEHEKWLAAWDEERERVEGHVDRKLEVLMSGITLDNEDGVGAGATTTTTTTTTADGRAVVAIHVDDTATASNSNADGEKMKELERENEALRERMNNMQHRDLAAAAARTPSRKIRVLKSRKWKMELDSADDEDDVAADATDENNNIYNVVKGAVGESNNNNAAAKVKAKAAPLTTMTTTTMTTARRVLAPRDTDELQIF